MTNDQSRRKSEFQMTKYSGEREHAFGFGVSCVVFNSSFDIRNSSFASFRFFHNVSQIGWTRVTGHLASENRRRVCGNEFIAFQNELWINSVAGRLIDFVAAEVTIELVFVIVIASDIDAFTVRREFLFLVQHHQFCRAPWLTRATDVTPELVIGFVVTPPDIIIPGRRFGGDLLRHLDSRLLDPLWNSFATGEEQYAERQICGE